MALSINPAPTAIGDRGLGSDGNWYECFGLNPTRVCRIPDQLSLVGNQSPVASGSAPAPQSFQLGNAMAAMDFGPCFTDPDGDTLTYSLILGGQTGITVDPATGIVTGTPTTDGVFIVTVRATDPSGAFADCSSSITVTTAANQAPVLTGNPPADQSIPVNTAMAAMDFAPCFNDPDGDTLTYSFVGAFPTGTSINSTTGVVSGIPTVVGVYTITVRATDPGGLFVDCTAQLTVTANNQAPMLTGNPPADQTITDGNAIALMGFAACFNDPDGDTLTYSWVSQPAGLSLNPTTGNVVGTPTGGPGTYTVTVRATDPGGLFVDCSAQITVQAAPSAVAFSNMPASCIVASQNPTDYLACDITFRPDGTMNWGAAGENTALNEPFSSAQNPGTWVTGPFVAANYEMRLTLNLATGAVGGGGNAFSGPFAGGADNWHNMANVVRRWVQLTGYGVRQSDFTVEIREVGTTTILASSTVNFDLEIVA